MGVTVRPSEVAAAEFALHPPTAPPPAPPELARNAFRAPTPPGPGAGVDELPPLPAPGRSDTDVHNVVETLTQQTLQEAGLGGQREADERGERQLLWRLMTQLPDQGLIEQVSDELFSQNIRRTLAGYLRELIGRQDSVSPDSVRAHAERHAAQSLYLPALHREIALVEQATTGRTADELLDSLGRTYRARAIASTIFREASRRFDDGEDIDKLIVGMENLLVDLGKGSRKKAKFGELVRRVQKQILDPDKSRAGLQLGLRDFDRQFGGMKRDRVITIGGYTGSGKTALLIDLIYRLLYYHKEKVAIKVFSLEMSEDRIVQRLFSRAARVSVKRQDDWWVKVRYDRDEDGNEVEVPLMEPLTDDEVRRIEQAGDFLQGMEEAIDVEYAAYSLEELERAVRQWALQHKGKHLVVMLDHIGLVKKDGNDNRVQFDNIMNGLKDIARRYDATVIPLVQLAKTVESRFNKADYFRPTSSDIMESVGVEAASDIVILLWRPHKHFERLPYVHPELKIYHSDDEDEESWWDCRHRMIAVIVKNRDGSAFNDIVFDADMAHSKLYNYDQLRREQPSLFETGQRNLFARDQLPGDLLPPPLPAGTSLAPEQLPF